MAPFNLSDAQVEALRHAAGLGGSDAARSLAKLLGAQVEGAPARAQLATAAGLEKALSADGPAFSAHFTVDGGAKMRVLIHFSQDGAALMAGLLLGAPVSKESAIYVSALAEATNIIVSSYVGGIAAATGLTLIPSIPYLKPGPLNAAVQATFGDLEGQVLLLATDLRLPGVRFAGRIVSAPEGDGTTRLLGSLGAA